MIHKILKYFTASLALASTFVFCFLVGKTGYNQFQINQTTEEYNLTKTIKELHYTTMLSQQLLTDQTWQTRSNVLQVTAQHDADYTANQLLKIMLTYDDSSSYNIRKEKAKNYAEQSILSNPDFFDNDKQKDGSHLINAKQLHSKFLNTTASIDFVNNNLCNVLIRSTSKHWTGTQSAKKLVVLYAGTYNLTTQKFQQLTYINTLSDQPFIKQAI